VSPALRPGASDSQPGKLIKLDHNTRAGRFRRSTAGPSHERIPNDPPDAFPLLRAIRFFGHQGSGKRPQSHPRQRRQVHPHKLYDEQPIIRDRALPHPQLRQIRRCQFSPLRARAQYASTRPSSLHACTMGTRNLSARLGLWQDGPIHSTWRPPLRVSPDRMGRASSRDASRSASLDFLEYASMPIGEPTQHQKAEPSSSIAALRPAPRITNLLRILFGVGAPSARGPSSTASARRQGKERNRPTKNHRRARAVRRSA